jgi:deferrochelatase/peroxidase EfeB
MSCHTCPNTDAWHRRQYDQIETTVGRGAAESFESEHEEVTSDELIEEHELGEHDADNDLDCPTCRAELIELGMAHLLPAVRS